MELLPRQSTPESGPLARATPHPAARRDRAVRRSERYRPAAPDDVVGPVGAPGVRAARQAGAARRHGFERAVAVAIVEERRVIEAEPQRVAEVGRERNVAA